MLPRPQDSRDRSAIAKLVLQPATGHTLTMTAEGREQDAEVRVLRLAASLPRVAAMAGEDQATRARASAQWEHRPGGGGTTA